MYIYIDESGDFGWPITANSEPYMMFTLLVINDYRSKKTIAQAVSRAITDLKKRHPSCKNDPSKHIKELKGSKELADCPDVRLSFFKRIAKKASFKIYSIILDKRLLKQKLPKDYMERYSMLLLNILYDVTIPKNQRWVTMVVDSQATAEPTQPVIVRYLSKSKRLKQKKARNKDRNRRNQYNQMITSVFRNTLKKKGTHLRVWHIRSNDDRCLQAVDVFSYFLFIGECIKEYRDEKKFISKLPIEKRNLIYLQTDKRWNKLKNLRSIWLNTYDVIKPKIALISRPDMLRRYTIHKLVRYAKKHQRTKLGGNREA